MAKFIIVLCAFIACAAAKPGLIAPLAYSAPLAYATPLAYANAPLDAAYASSRVDINQKYTNAVVPTTFSAVAPVAPIAPVAPVATPLKYTAAVPVAYANAPLDAAYASSRVDINQKYYNAVVPTTFSAVAPVAPVAAVATPLKYTAAVPVAYANAPLDAAYASSRLDINQKYFNAAVAPVATPLKYTAATPVLL